MHWYNIFTIIVALSVGVLSFVGTQWATRRQMKDALAARLQADLDEHRRWRRDEQTRIYIKLLAYARPVEDLRHSPLQYAPEVAQSPDPLPLPMRQDAFRALENVRLHLMGHDSRAMIDAHASDEIRELASSLERAAWIANFALVEPAPERVVVDGDEWSLLLPAVTASAQIIERVRAEIKNPRLQDESIAPPRLDSNQRHPVPETGALSTELRGDGARPRTRTWYAPWRRLYRPLDDPTSTTRLG